MYKSILVISISMLSLIFAAEWIGITNENPTQSQAIILSGSESETTIEFTLDGFWKNRSSLGETGGYILELEEGTPLLEVTAPDVQKLSTSIIIPDFNNMEVEVLDFEYVDFDHYSVAPSKGNLTRDIDPSSVPFVFGDVYNQDQFYPGSLAELGSPYIIRDFRGQAVQVFPLQFNPVTQSLRVYTSITVHVYATDEIGENPLNRQEELQSMNSEYKSIYQHHFNNYNNFVNNRYDILDEDGSMLIICYSAFMDDLQPLVEWKNMSGLKTTLVDVNDIGSNSSAISQFVEDFYYDENLAYLLLVGDIAQMPSITVGGDPSDPSYGFIEGNDAYPEVMVGRFSAESATHVQTQVERSINYERYPMADADWYHKGTGIGSAEGSGIGDEGEADWQHQDNIRGKLMDYTYTEVDQVYDPGANSGQVTAAVNDGRSVMNYTGHGSSTAWSTSGFNVNNVNNLVNDNKLPFIWSVACVNGQFQNGTCFAEAWLRATNDGTPTGAIGAFMSTINQSWAPPMDGQDEFNDILVELFDNNIKRSFGGISANGCMHMNDNYGSGGENETTYWTLFGDPSIMVRTDTPINATVEHDDVMVIGSTECPVSVPGLTEGTAALSVNGELIGVGSLDENGFCNIILEEPVLEPMEVDLVVTGYNMLTYEGSILVIVPEGPYVIMDDYSFTSDSNGNGEVDAGESIEMFVNAENVGVDNAQNVSGIISTDDPYITFIDNEVSFGDIETGENLTSEDSFTFDISTDVQIDSDYSISFAIDLTDGTNTWQSSFNIMVNTSCITGDVNFDWDINVLDIIRTVGIIIGTGNPALDWEICSADIDDNNIINILDIINIINFVVGQSSDRVASQPANFKIGENGLSLNSSGDISGIQMSIRSNDIIVNTQTGMNTEYQSRDGETIILMYSVVGNTFNAGDIELFTSPEFEINSIIVAGRDGEEVFYEFSEIPASYSLHQNFPNPFNPTTNIKFLVPVSGTVKLAVYDILGQEINSLLNEYVTAGEYNLTWNGQNADGVKVPSGIYLYRLTGENVNMTRKMILMK
ncbi:MAG: T9SS type A sorting domain-containing protein [Candidatus Marinimicrobia bacterium]|jgi:hypothetical protein|nr:T9SS type A sorting domain-containing protein [Candidatus Neomarinimicrobiota bacterium]MBT3634249.1 T9SS type A sorting domain-containing protein [Candidatus Neomarinimicrobiota bacterium]MBT3682952.1 T9SS type A sorting domain-containing protein [Candidatus Neomarinimicrobiota bacterium]MBT3760058.1 T9SS type A sorting domain-containing protein [Candidatus Neomarinimicrobiota bacterium]MBT3896175.1 T9SS type A sorting domain-containing protein [Candidatus Neomarinimicrobiota bacterium]